MFHRNGPSLRELLVQGLSSTVRGYDLLAPKFEYTPFRTPDAVLGPCMNAIAEERVERALDVCCGTGAALRLLRPLAEREVVGVDLSSGMLAEARARLRDAKGPAHVDLVRGDALALPFHGRFDVVTCFGAFGHILENDEPRLVREIASALRPGGRFVFATSDEPSLLRPGYWIARGFNAVMRVRNALRKPEFVMYYLTFLLPRATALLEAEGFTVEVRRNVFSRPFRRGVLVIARRR